MDGENLYSDTKKLISDRIYDGTFREGEKIPPERVLCEELGISRVTLRKSLELLTAEGLLLSEARSGTQIVLPNRGVAAENADMAVLIAPASNPFFSEFIRCFQIFGQREEIMVLHVEKPYHTSLEDTVYRLLGKGFQNFVIWPEDISVDSEKLKRLRALGADMVFFDTDAGLPYADCVALDNEDAVGVLLKHIHNQGMHDIGYIGWDKNTVYSIRERERAFLETKDANIFLSLPWEKRRYAKELTEEALKRHMDHLPEALICGDRECGAAAAAAMQELQLKDLILSCVDEFPGTASLHRVFLKQDLDKTVGRIFRCLHDQNSLKERWKAKMYKIKGCLKEYSG